MMNTAIRQSSCNCEGDSVFLEMQIKIDFSLKISSKSGTPTQTNY